MLNYRVLRYVPDSGRSEFVNIGVVVLDDDDGCAAVKMGDEDDLRRVRCLHPAADLELIRSAQSTFQVEAQQEAAGTAKWLEAMDEVASLSLQWTGAAGYDGNDPQQAAQVLYETLVASPPRAALGARSGTGPWVKREADSVFRAAHLLERFESSIPAQQFTWPGDPFRIHYAYRNGGGPHYIHMLSLRHSVQQAKVLAFTFARMRGDGAAFTAIVEPEPPPLPTVDFTRRTLEETGIDVLPLDRIQSFVYRVKRELGV